MFCQNLQQLDLISTLKTQDNVKIFAASLKNFSNLRELDIGNNHIGNEGAKQIAGPLTYCHQLEKLRIANNNITAASGAFDAIFTALKGNKLKVNFDDVCNNNQITEEDLINCLGPCIHLQSLKITIDRRSIEPFKRFSQNWKHLTVLNVVREKFLNADIGLAITGCNFKNVEELSLVDCRISMAGAIAVADALSNCNTLQILNLSLNCIDDNSARSIFSSLQRNTSLRKLNMSANLIGNFGVQALTIYAPTSRF